MGASDEPLSEFCRLGDHRGLSAGDDRAGRVVRERPAQHPGLFSGQPQSAVVERGRLHYCHRDQRPDVHWRAGHGFWRGPDFHSNHPGLRHRADSPRDRVGAVLFQRRNLFAVSTVCAGLWRTGAAHGGGVFPGGRHARRRGARLCHLHSPAIDAGDECAARHCALHRAVARLHLSGRHQGGGLDGVRPIFVVPGGGAVRIDLCAHLD
ncbi:MAG: hypothetical protein BWX84_01962 [Verrucomicrobia bacterium ADurb.Bin118]|nr:MAG: hypothetical protein BWX84_01962 [Verrucomicrobia bacterium ADurb.Bin118]